MAHNLEFRKGRASIAYNQQGGTPWHKFGQALQDAFDARTALDQAGLNFTVEKTPIAFADSGRVIAGQFAVRRTDTGAALGIVGNYYQPLQNHDAFAFFDAVFGKDQAELRQFLTRWPLTPEALNRISTFSCGNVRLALFDAQSELDGTLALEVA